MRELCNCAISGRSRGGWQCLDFDLRRSPRLAGRSPAAAEGDGPEPRRDSSSQQKYVQRKSNRKCVRLAGGVEWQRLTAQPDDEVEFLQVTYEVNAESSPERSLFRHGGKEYAYVLAGRLGVQIGFVRYELGPGDSVSFNSQLPHRLTADKEGWPAARFLR